MNASVDQARPSVAPTPSSAPAAISQASAPRVDAAIVLQVQAAVLAQDGEGGQRVRWLAPE